LPTLSVAVVIIPPNICGIIIILARVGMGRVVDVARKNLVEERSRFVLSVSGLAFAVFLMLLLSGIFNAITIFSVAYFEDTSADIWVGQKGTPATGLSSLLSTKLHPQLLQIAGVKEAHSILTFRSFVKVGDSQASVTLVGYDPNTGDGGPWKVIQGTSLLRGDQVVVDKAFSRVYGFPIGSSIDILGTNFTVVGLSDETNLWFSQYLFLRSDDLANVLRLRNTTSYFLVSVADPSRANDVAQKISQALDVSAFTKDQVVSASRDAAQKNILPILFLMSAIGFVVGTAVVGLTVFTLVFEKIREYAVLRAIGARNSKLYSIVIEQSLIVALTGFAVGLMVSASSSILIQDLMPLVTVILDAPSITQVFVLTIAMSLVSSYIPVRRVAKVDPAMVFRS